MSFPLMLGALAGARPTARGSARRIGDGLEARRRDLAEGQPPVQAQPHSVLASDAERDRTAGHIARAMGEARLGLDEGTDRIDTIWRARHRHELVELVSDLPPAPGPGRRKVGAGAVLALLLSLGAVAVQGVLGLWELWPIAVGMCLLVAFRSRR